MSGIIPLLQKDPTALLTEPQNSVKVLQLVKAFFDPITKGNSILDEIYVDGLDASQVWPQSKIILDNVVDDLMFVKIPSLKTASDDENESDLEEQLSQSENDEEDQQDEEESQEDEKQETLVDDYEDSDVESEADELEEQEDHVDDNGEEAKQQSDAFGLNDNFFSIDDFNRQTLQQDNDDFEEDGEEIDFNADIPSSEDEEEEVIYFDDFFDKPNSNKTKYNQSHRAPKSSTAPKIEQEKAEEEEEEEDDDDDDDDEHQRLNEKDFDEGMNTAMLDLYDEEEDLKPKAENLSSFEKQQLQIQKEIAQLEKESIAEKRWTMKGESKAKDRPEDSLLAEELEFERTAKPVPVITKEVTESLEEMIRRRIKEGNFDDIPRRIISDVTNFKSFSTFELSQAKSSKSLAELYEDDFKGEGTNSAVSEELQKSHDEIKSMFQSISYKLDALSSAHFIPKPAEKAIDIKVNTPAISMEDAQPLTLSNASTLAPQEIYRASRSADANEITLKSGAVLSREELSREDKHRLRRANKRKRSKEFKKQESNENYKKSKKQDAIDTLSKARNVTIIGAKGEKRDVRGSLKVDKAQQGTSSFKL